MSGKSILTLVVLLIIILSGYEAYVNYIEPTFLNNHANEIKLGDDGVVYKEIYVTASSTLEITFQANVTLEVCVLDESQFNSYTGGQYSSYSSTKIIGNFSKLPSSYVTLIPSSNSKDIKIYINTSGEYFIGLINYGHHSGATIYEFILSTTTV